MLNVYSISSYDFCARSRYDSGKKEWKERNREGERGGQSCYLVEPHLNEKWSARVSEWVTQRCHQWGPISWAAPTPAPAPAGGNYANRLKIAHWNRTISYKVFLIWVNLAFTFLINFSSAIKIQFLAWPTLINGRAISQSCEGETNGERVGGEEDVKAACEKDAKTVGQTTKTTTTTIEKR